MFWLHGTDRLGSETIPPIPSDLAATGVEDPLSCLAHAAMLQYCLGNGSPDGISEASARRSLLGTEA